MAAEGPGDGSGARPYAGRSVVIFSGGDASRPEELHGVARDAVVIAADSGAEHALALGWRVDRLVGDLDSIDPATLRRLEASGTTVERHPEAKDKTDLALALDVARTGGAARITVVGGHGGRLDHLLANALLLGADRYATIELDARMGPARLTVVRRRRELLGQRGDLVTLLPLGGAATGVSTEGLLFPLHDATVEAGSTWGVSNELLAERAVVSVSGGVIAAVQPGARGALADRAQWGGP
jgi:thiamine pyrophosphokinase